MGKAPPWAANSVSSNQALSSIRRPAARARSPTSSDGTSYRTAVRCLALIQRSLSGVAPSSAAWKSTCSPLVMSMAIGWERCLPSSTRRRPEIQGVVLAERRELQFVHFSQDAADERRQGSVRLRFGGVRIEAGEGTGEVVKSFSFR